MEKASCASDTDKPLQKKSFCCFMSLRRTTTTGPSDKKPPHLPERKSSEPVARLRSLASSTKSRPIAYLTAKERQAVVKSWKKVPDKQELGERIYMHIFMQKPMLLQLFSFQDVGIDRIREEPAFAKQATRFAHFLQSAVDYVSRNDLTNLKTLAKWTGQRHAYITRVKFQPEWWQLFILAVLACLQPYSKNAPLAMDGWKKVLEELVDDMVNAFEEAQKEMTHGALSSTGASVSSLPYDGSATSDYETPSEACSATEEASTSTDKTEPRTCTKINE